MRARAIAYGVVLVLVVAFVVANWATLTAPIEVNFLITRAFVPGAVLVLVLLGLIALIDWSVHAIHHSEWRRQRRAMEEEIRRLRVEAGKEGDVRYDNLRALIERESARIHERLDTFATRAPRETVRTDPELAAKRTLKH